MTEPSTEPLPAPAPAPEPLTPFSATKRLLTMARQDSETLDMAEVETLIAAGANLNAAPRDYRTADESYPPDRPLMHLAVENGHHDLLKALIRHGADMELANGNNWTPLLLATWPKVYPEAARILIDAGASVTRRDNVGDTPLHNAMLKNGLDTIQYLISRRPDIELNGLNNSGSTCLRHGYNNGHREAVRLLLDAGARITLKDLPSPYQGESLLSEKHIMRKMVLDQMETAKARWSELTLHGKPDIAKMTAKDMCYLFNIDKQDEVMHPILWRKHKPQLEAMLQELPPCQTHSMMKRYGWLANMFSTPQTQVSDWQREPVALKQPPRESER